MSLVVFIGSVIFFYSFYYMASSNFLTSFYLFKSLFVLSMVILIVSNNGVTMFVGWDGLGITSYFLVVFYLNWKSNNSGLITILSNRVGDSLFMATLSFFLTCQIWSSISIGLFKSPMLILLLGIGLFLLTKSAQYPFSVWLPMAMAAPTPISALVHSSTLVTAGIVLFIRFFEFMTTDSLFVMIILSSFLTLIHSGILSMVEMDLKKIVALSTLNQLSLMLLSISTGLKMSCFFHLNTHAIFKSLLFLNVGIFLHSLFSLQDKRKFSLMAVSLGLVPMSIFCSSIALMGISFTSGFLSKDLILESMSYSFMSMVFVFLLFMCMAFTFVYTSRIFFSLIFLKAQFPLLSFISSGSTLFPLFILSSMSLYFGSIIHKNFFEKIFVNMLSSGGKSVLPLLMICSILSLNTTVVSQLLLKTYFSSMFFLSFVSFGFNKMTKPLHTSLNNLFEMSWLEMLPNSMIFQITQTYQMFFLKKNKKLIWISFLFLMLFSFV